MADKRFILNKTLTSDYLEQTVHETAHILLPKNLPIKITVAGIRTIVHVGEFAIIPPGCTFAINSSPERYLVDFDFNFIKDNPDFTILLPIITKPCIFHPVITEEGKNSGYTNWYTKSTPMANSENQAGNSVVNIINFKHSPVYIVQELIEILKSNKLHFSEALSTSKILELYSMLGEEIYTNSLDGKHETAASSGISANLSASIRFILEHYGEDISLENVAESAGYSRTHYSKLFKDFYKISFYDFLQDVRVQAATKLLTDTDLSISDIGSSSGFSSSSTLNRVFKQETGYSPREYRKDFKK